VQFFGRPTGAAGKKGSNLLNGLLLQKMLPEQPRPPLLQYLPPFGAQKASWVEEMLLFVVFDTNHAFPRLSCRNHMGFHTIAGHRRQGENIRFFNFFRKIGLDDFLPVHQNWKE
jgi:hypothetical protein